MCFKPKILSAASKTLSAQSEFRLLLFKTTLLPFEKTHPFKDIHSSDIAPKRKEVYS